MGYHHGIGRAQCWHLAVTCNITVAIIKTIEIVAYLLSDNTKLILGLYNMNEWWRWHRSHTLACFGLNFVCHLTFFTDLTTGNTTVRTFVPRLLTAASRIQNCTYRKIITYQTPQSNLPIDYTLNSEHWTLNNYRVRSIANPCQSYGLCYLGVTSVRSEPATQRRPTIVLGSVYHRETTKRNVINGWHGQYDVTPAVVKDLQEVLDDLPTDTPLSRIILVGRRNDCDTDGDDLDVSGIIAQYKDLVACAKTRAWSVTICSVCPRIKSDTVSQRIESLNAGLKGIASDLEVDFLDKNPIFYLQDGTLNDGYLLADGVHLTRLATNRLVTNMQLSLRQGVTSAHSDHRRRNADQDPPTRP